MQLPLYSLTSLIARHVQPTKNTNASISSGICAFCAMEKKGYNAIDVMKELKLFTRYGDIELYGNTICFDCFKVFRNQKVRYRNWIVSLSEWRSLKRNEILNVILNPLDGPWALYITESHKKHGWIRGMYAINYNNDSNVYIIHEEFLLETNVKEIKKVSNLAQQLLNAGYSKSQVKGNWTPVALNELMESNLYPVYLELKKYENTSLLYIIVYLCESKRRKRKK